MLRYANYGVVFSEIPDETTLTINISGCVIRCKGCHSKYLWDEIGTPLDYGTLKVLLEKYASDITCVCFMGGDKEPEMINALAVCVKSNYPNLKVGWFSGCDTLNPWVSAANFDYIKLGQYKEELGGLTKETTNQRMYEVLSNGRYLKDITHKYWKK